MGTRDDTTTDHTADAAGSQSSDQSHPVPSQRFGPVSFPDLPPVPEPDSLLEPIEAEVVPLPTDERSHRDSAGGPVPFADQVPATEQVLPSWVPRGDNAEAPPTAYVPPWAGQDNSTAGHPGTGGFNTGGFGAASSVNGSPGTGPFSGGFPAATGPQPAQPNVPPYPDGSEQTTVIPPVAPPAGFDHSETRHDQTGHNHVESPVLQGDSRPLDDGTLVKRERQAPRKGWRRAVYKATGGTINPRNPRSEVYREKLVSAIRTPLAGDYRIAVLSLKGGVGKTTTAIALGSTLASLRGDRVIAVDANPDLGTLAQRLPRETDSTVRDLLADRNLNRYSDIREHTSQAPSRLEVLASERDPAAAEAFNDEEYRGVLGILQRFYNIIITDCGTGLSNSVMKGVLDTADSIIVVSSPAIDGARSAASTLDWLDAHGFGRLVSSAIVVISSSRPGSPNVDIEQMTEYFSARCRAIRLVGFDDHLAEGADVDLNLMSKSTRMAFMELAATVATDFTNPRHR